MCMHTENKHARSFHSHNSMTPATLAEDMPAAPGPSLTLAECVSAAWGPSLTLAQELSAEQPSVEVSPIDPASGSYAAALLGA